MSFPDCNFQFVRHRRRPCRNIFKIVIFFSRTTRPISTKLGTKHSRSNEWPRTFPRGDFKEIAKIH